MNISLIDIAKLPLLTEASAKPIKEYCVKRKFRCKGCRYEVEAVNDSRWTCMFANCPCDWNV